MKDWTEALPGIYDRAMQERYRLLQIEKAEAFEYASMLTTWLAQQYGLSAQVQQCRARNSYYRWRNGHIIRYSLNGLRQAKHYGYGEYKTVRYCWDDAKLSAKGFEGVHHVVLHEFAHVLDAEYGPRAGYTNAPTYHYSGCKRIIHGIPYQRWLQELIILVPFDEVTPGILDKRQKEATT